MGHTPPKTIEAEGRESQSTMREDETNAYSIVKALNLIKGFVLFMSEKGIGADSSRLCNTTDSPSVYWTEVVCFQAKSGRIIYVSTLSKINSGSMTCENPPSPTV